MAISLSKGQTISLAKESAGLSKIHMGLGWDPVKKKVGFLASLLGGGGGGGGDIDLDASCLMFDQAKQLVDIVWFRQLKSKDGAVTHTGDNLTGEGDGDDESIIVDLDRLPAGVQTLVFTVNSFRGQTFDEVENAFLPPRRPACGQGDRPLHAHRAGRTYRRRHGGGQPCRRRVDDEGDRHARERTHRPGSCRRGNRSYLRRTRRPPRRDAAADHLRRIEGVRT